MLSPAADPGPAPATPAQRASFALWLVARVEIAPSGFAQACDLWVDHMAWAARTVGAEALQPDQLREALAAIVDPWEVCREGFRGLRLKAGGHTLRAVQ